MTRFLDPIDSSFRVNIDVINNLEKQRKKSIKKISSRASIRIFPSFFFLSTFSRLEDEEEENPRSKELFFFSPRSFPLVIIPAQFSPSHLTRHRKELEERKANIKEHKKTPCNAMLASLSLSSLFQSN